MTKKILSSTLAALIVVSVTPAMAHQDEGAAEVRNLFETAEAKQTAADFKPAPDEIETSFGPVVRVSRSFSSAMQADPGPISAGGKRRRFRSETPGRDRAPSCHRGRAQLGVCGAFALEFSRTKPQEKN